ncbi:MAG: SOS response-associated peptidase [Myxococcales bacterium]
MRPRASGTTPSTMCGRFTQTVDTATLAARFKAVTARATVSGARYNIAPTDFVPVVVLQGGAPALEEFRWGLIPSWAKDLRQRPQPINAKSETLATSGLFRRLLPTRRCLVLADSFFEWRQTAGNKVPLRFTLRGREPFAFAGLFDVWRDPAKGDAPPLRSCTIVTVGANALVQPVHDRMPAILSPENEERWLDPERKDPLALAELLAPYAPEAMESYEVNRAVSDARNKGPECIEPATPEPEKPAPKNLSLFPL